VAAPAKVARGRLKSPEKAEARRMFVSEKLDVKSAVCCPDDEDDLEPKRKAQKRQDSEDSMSSQSEMEDREASDKDDEISLEDIPEPPAPVTNQKVEPQQAIPKPAPAPARAVINLFIKDEATAAK